MNISFGDKKKTRSLLVLTQLDCNSGQPLEEDLAEKTILNQ